MCNREVLPGKAALQAMVKSSTQVRMCASMSIWLMPLLHDILPRPPCCLVLLLLCDRLQRCQSQIQSLLLLVDYLHSNGPVSPS